MFCVYKIKFTKSPYDLNEDYDRLSDIDKEKIADMNADSFFDYEEDGVYTFFTIAEPIEVKRYLGVLSENLVRFELTDLSKDVLKGNFDIDSEVGDKVEPLDSIKFSFFILKNLGFFNFFSEVSSFLRNSSYSFFCFSETGTNNLALKQV